MFELTKLDISFYFPPTWMSVYTLRKKASIHLVTTMLATSENVLFPGHSHLQTTSTDEPTLWLLPVASESNNQCVGSSVPLVSRWL